MLLDRLENILINIDLEKGYERLTKRERNIISLYYLAGYTDKEISKFYGISRQIITRLRGKGITKLKKY
jgi:RNA polymerase sigma factor (sigma-70 family)